MTCRARSRRPGGRRQRPRAQRRLDDDGPRAQRRDQPVAHQEAQAGGRACPAACSLTTRPVLRRPGRAAGRCRAGRRRRRRRPARRRSARRPLVRAPRCAAPSMPYAPPLTTVQPRSARPAAELAGDVLAVRRGGARADHRDRVLDGRGERAGPRTCSASGGAGSVCRSAARSAGAVGPLVVAGHHHAPDRPAASARPVGFRVEVPAAQPCGRRRPPAVTRPIGRPAAARASTSAAPYAATASCTGHEPPGSTSRREGEPRLPVAHARPRRSDVAAPSR